MKNIKQILAIAILGMFAVACTDEDQFNNETKVNNKSTLSNSYDQRDHTYEDVHYTKDQTIAIMQKFDSLMRGQSTTSEYEIKEALFAMEFYYNYAVVDKQEKYDTTSYDGQTFTFSVDLNSNGNIDVDVLRENYNTFLNYVLTSMGDKYLQYSDLYVSNITNQTITFSLEMVPFHFNDHLFRSQIIKSNSDIVTVTTESSNWLSIPNPPTDEIVRILCKKDVYNCLFSNINTSTMNTYFLYTIFKIYEVFSNNSSDFVFTGNTRLRDLLVYPTIHMTNSCATYVIPNSNIQRTAIDVWPNIYYDIPGATGKSAYMAVAQIKNAQLIYFTPGDNLHAVTTHLVFPIE